MYAPAIVPYIVGAMSVSMMFLGVLATASPLILGFVLQLLSSRRHLSWWVSHAVSAVLLMLFILKEGHPSVRFGGEEQTWPPTLDTLPIFIAACLVSFAMTSILCQWGISLAHWRCVRQKSQKA